MAEQKSTHITWHDGRIGRRERQTLLKQRGATIWLTGLSGSGKSTLAVTAEAALVERGHLAYVLDGDNVRHGLNRNLGFSPDDRAENIRRIGEVARLFTETGVIVFTSFISPYRADRDAARALFDRGDFIEVHVDASVETCESRDPKGLYKKALAGEIKGFTGIDDPYEEPERAEVVVNTAEETIDESLGKILRTLELMNCIPPAESDLEYSEEEEEEIKKRLADLGYI